MAALLTQRCLHHPAREAVARCPECGLFFCRECVTEHEDRVVCSSCLKRLQTPRQARRRGLAPLWRIGAALCGALFAWLFFYAAGRMLASTPAAFHEGAIWKGNWLDSDQEDP